MARIFFALSLFAFLLLLGNLTIGFLIGDFGGTATELIASKRRVGELQRSVIPKPEELQKEQQALNNITQQFDPIHLRKTIHVWLGITAVLVTLLVNAVSVTYFIGTNRWCREVVMTYGLDKQLALQSTIIKRRTFPWSLGSMLVLLIIVLLGAASDPTANTGGWSQWILPHYMCAIMGTLFMGWAFLVQVGAIGANYDIIERILVLVEEIRGESTPQEATAGS